MQTVKVRHNMEMAHRLYETTGKCENVHGHSWWVTLELGGLVDHHGLLLGLDFATVKSAFRRYLDTEFDHRLLLNSKDPWAQPWNPTGSFPDEEAGQTLPGLQPFEGDPTTENLARAIGRTMSLTFPMCPYVTIEVWETSVNCATWRNRA